MEYTIAAIPQNRVCTTLNLYTMVDKVVNLPTIDKVGKVPTVDNGASLLAVDKEKDLLSQFQSLRQEL